jgi:archaellum biogenesis protein FlaJ (TadC family)
LRRLSCQTLGRRVTPHLILGIFLVIPIVVHYRTYDSLNGSAASALLIGISCSLVSFVKQPWQVAPFVFFISSFIGFAISHLIGMVYRAFGSEDRRNYVAKKESTPPSDRRVAIGAIGAIAIPVVFFSVEIASWVQTGVWRTPMDSEAVLGFAAFGLLGVASLLSIFFKRRAEK